MLGATNLFIEDEARYVKLMLSAENRGGLHYRSTRLKPIVIAYSRSTGNEAFLLMADDLGGTLVFWASTVETV